MSLSSAQYDSSGVRFTTKPTIGGIGQCVTNFLRNGAVADAYLAHEAVLQFMADEAQKQTAAQSGGFSGGKEQSKEHPKPAADLIGAKISTAARNMPDELSPHEVVARLSAVCGYFELTPYLVDAEFADVNKRFVDAFEKVWGSASSETAPEHPKEVDCKIPYYFAVCFASSGMPSASLGKTYVPDSRVFPGLILGNETLFKKVNCANLAPGEAMHRNKLQFIAELLQYATEDFYKSFEMLSFAASALGYALFSGNIDLFIKNGSFEGEEEEDDGDEEDSIACRALEFIDSSLSRQSDIVTEVILAFWNGAKHAIHQGASTKAVNHENATLALDALSTLFDTFSLTNLSLDDLKKSMADNCEDFFASLKELFSTFGKGLASCYQLSSNVEKPSDLSFYSFGKVSMCLLGWCIQFAMLAFATSTTENLKENMQNVLSDVLTPYNFWPAYSEYLDEAISIEGADDKLVGSLTTSIAHTFCIICDSFNVDPSVLFYTGNSKASLALLWNLYLAISEILEVSRLSTLLEEYLCNSKAIESINTESSLGLMVLSLSANINESGDCTLLTDTYNKLKGGSDAEKKLFLSYVVRKVQNCRSLPADYVNAIRDTVSTMEDVSTPHCKVAYAYLESYNMTPVPDKQVNLLSPGDCDIVGALVAFREKRNNSPYISRHCEMFLKTLVGKNLDEMLQALFQKDALKELSIPEVKVSPNTFDDKKTEGNRVENDSKGKDEGAEEDEEEDSEEGSEDGAHKAAADRIKVDDEDALDYYFRRSDVTHLAALLEIIYVSIHHTDGITDYLVMNVLIPLLFSLIKLHFEKYETLLEVLSVSYEWSSLTRFTGVKGDKYTDGERRLATILGWLVCIVDRLGEIYYHSTILWSMLKGKVGELCTKVYNEYIKTPKEMLVSFPLAIVVSYFLTVISTNTMTDVTSDLLNLAAANIVRMKHPNANLLEDKRLATKKPIFAEYLTVQLAPLKISAQEAVITSCAVIALELKINDPDVKQEDKVKNMDQLKIIFGIISLFVKPKDPKYACFTAEKVEEVSLAESDPDPLERNYLPPGIVSDKFYITLLELFVDAYRDECVNLFVACGLIIDPFVRKMGSDLSCLSKYQLACILGLLSIIVHDRGTFPENPFCSKEKMLSILNYASGLKNYFTSIEEAHVLLNAIQVICNYLMRFETYEYEGLKTFVELMKNVRDHDISKDIPPETLLLMCKLKETACAAFMALADNKAFSGKYDMRASSPEMKKTLELMLTLPWKNQTALDISFNLLNSMIENGLFSRKKAATTFDLATSVLEYLEEKLEEEDDEFMGDDS